MMADKENLRSVNLIQVESNVNVCFDGSCKKKTSHFLTEKFDTEHGHSFLGEYINVETEVEFVNAVTAGGSLKFVPAV